MSVINLEQPFMGEEPDALVRYLYRLVEQLNYNLLQLDKGITAVTEASAAQSEPLSQSGIVTLNVSGTTTAYGNLPVPELDAEHEVILAAYGTASGNVTCLGQGFVYDGTWYVSVTDRERSPRANTTVSMTLICAALAN